MHGKQDGVNICESLPSFEYKVHSPGDSRLFIRNDPPGVYDPGAGEKLTDCVRDAMRARHYNRRTAQGYSRWIKRYILFHNKPHPLRMGENEINSA